MKSREKDSRLEKLILAIERLKERIPLGKQGEFIAHLIASAEVLAVEYIHVPPEEKIGECYLAFRSDEEPDVVLKGLHELKEKSRSPKKMELILYHKKSQVPLDANLPQCWDDIAGHDPDDDLRYPYLLRARLKSATNKQVYDHVSDMLEVLLAKRAPFPVCNEGENFTDERYVKVGRKYVLADMYYSK